MRRSPHFARPSLRTLILQSTARKSADPTGGEDAASDVGGADEAEARLH